MIFYRIKSFLSNIQFCIFCDLQSFSTKDEIGLNCTPSLKSTNLPRLRKTFRDINALKIRNALKNGVLQQSCDTTWNLIWKKKVLIFLNKNLLQLFMFFACFLQKSCGRITWYYVLWTWKRNGFTEVLVKCTKLYSNLMQRSNNYITICVYEIHDYILYLNSSNF